MRQVLEAKTNERGGPPDQGQETPGGASAEDELDDEELEANYKQLEAELFKNKQIERITRQRYRNFIKYRYQTEQRGMTTTPRSREQVKQQIRNEIRDGILKHNILEPDQLPNKYEKQDSKASL